MRGGELGGSVWNSGERTLTAVPLGSVGVGNMNKGILSVPGESPVLTWLAWWHSGKSPCLGG